MSEIKHQLTDDEKALVESIDTGYVRHWEEEAQGWSNEMLYHQMADLQEPSGPEHTHLDLGTGFGFYLQALKRAYPEMTLLGVEHNYYMIEAALSAFYMNEKFPASAYACYSHHIKGDHSLALELAHRPEEIGKMRGEIANAGSVTLIMDDLRRLKIIQDIIGTQKMDSMSMVFPGTSIKALFEAPGGFTRENAGNTRYISSVMRDTRKAALKAAAKFLCPGGTFLLVDRLTSQGDPEGDMHLFEQGIIELLEDEAKYFGEIDTRVRRLTANHLRKTIDWIAHTKEGKAVNANEGVEVIVMSALLTRNQIISTL